MSRTYKDAPLWVQGYRHQNKKVRRDYNHWRDMAQAIGHLKEWHLVTWDEAKHWWYNKERIYSWDGKYLLRTVVRDDPPSTWKDYWIERYPKNYKYTDEYELWDDITDEPWGGKRGRWWLWWNRGRYDCYWRDNQSYRSHVRDMIKQERYDDIESYKMLSWG
jgi:hypothetical protein